MTDNIFTDLWRVKLSDWERGLVCAILGMPIGIVYDWATMDNFEFSWRSLFKGAVSGGLAYIGKNLSTGRSGNLLRNS